MNSCLKTIIFNSTVCRSKFRIKVVIIELQNVIRLSKTIRETHSYHPSDQIINIGRWQRQSMVIIINPVVKTTT